MSAPPIGIAGLRRGFVLVAVLGGVLIVGAVAFAMLFTASLESMAVRARQDGVVAREALEGALALTAAELAVGLTALPAEADGPGAVHELGPWPEHDLPVVVTVERLPAADAGAVVRLTATYQPGSDYGAPRAAESMVLSLQPDLRLLRR